MWEILFTNLIWWFVIEINLDFQLNFFVVIWIVMIEWLKYILKWMNYNLNERIWNRNFLVFEFGSLYSLPCAGARLCGVVVSAYLFPHFPN